MWKLSPRQLGEGPEAEPPKGKYINQMASPGFERFLVYMAIFVDISGMAGAIGT